MSESNTTRITGSALAWLIGALFFIVVAGCVTLAVALEASSNPAGLIALLLTTFSSLIVTVGGFFGINAIREQQKVTAQQVNELSNGVGDKKIQDAVRQVMDERG